MGNSFLMESFKEKENRLKILNEIDVKRIILKQQLYELEKQAKSITDTDEDYKQYIERYQKCFYFGSVDYEKYCSLLKLFMESSPDSELHIKLSDVLKIHCPIVDTTDNDTINVFNKKLWQQVLEIVSKKLSELEFRTWIAPLKLISTDKNSIKLIVPNEFSKAIIKEKYESVLLNSIHEITENIEFIDYSISEG
ncbi:MAG TPA: DnaA N-terminal domain-containing protein [Clostridiaceae bacterium]